MIVKNMASLLAIEHFISYLHETQTEFVDFRFTDLLGTWHHMSFPVKALSTSMLSQGVCFDGSSLPGWCAINKSDMLMVPLLDESLSHVVRDPFMAHATVCVLCEIVDPVTGTVYRRDPRSVAVRAEAYLKTSLVADTAYFGPEAEFFIFDRIRFKASGYESFYEIDASEAPHNNEVPFSSLSLGHRPQHKSGYFPLPPLDAAHDLRSDMVIAMEQMGLVIEKHHHEVAPSQHEIGFRYGTLVDTADHIQIYKYVVKNVANRYGKSATFMPKPILGDNGSGMHVHQSLWKEGTALFAGDGYAGLSETALFYIGGILKHAKSLNAFTNPTTNSYKRLVPGFEAPVNCAYSLQNRSAACRIPFSEGLNQKRVEVRFPDPSCNSYLALAAMLMAGLDGIENKIHPGHPQTADLFENKHISDDLPKVCGSLREALEALERDHDYLLKGHVFSKDLIHSYCELKWKEVHQWESHPHPIEFITTYGI